MFNFLFNPSGRVSRKGIWLGLLFPQMALGFAAALVDGVSMGAALAAGQTPTPGLLSMLVSLFFLWPSIVVPLKRFHDRGMSGWWVLWFVLIVVAGLAFMFMDLAAASQTGQGSAGSLIGLLVAGGASLVQFVILYLLPGQDGSNQYGPDPRNGSGRAVSIDDGGPSWADRIDPARTAVRAKPAAAAPVVAPAGVNWPNSASMAPRASFGRRGA